MTWQLMLISRRFHLRTSIFQVNFGNCPIDWVDTLKLTKYGGSGTTPTSLCAHAGAHAADVEMCSTAAAGHCSQHLTVDSR